MKFDVIKFGKISHLVSVGHLFLIGKRRVSLSGIGRFWIGDLAGGRWRCLAWHGSRAETARQALARTDINTGSARQFLYPRVGDQSECVRVVVLFAPDPGNRQVCETAPGDGVAALAFVRHRISPESRHGQGCNIS